MTTTTTNEAAVHTAPDITIENPLVTFTPLTSGAGNVIVLVGAGGTGARVAVQLAKLMGREDRLLIYDPDHVEQRNLLRQHFVPQDVGRSKAEVVADRVNMTLPEGATVTPFREPFTAATARETIRAAVFHNYQLARAVIFIGCVDNQAARREISAAWRLWVPGRVASAGAAYIDCGNAMRSGQVGLSFRWVGRINTFPPRGGVMLMDVDNPRPVSDRTLAATWLEYDAFGLSGAFPSFMDQQDDDEVEGCALRIDTQSLAANQWAATIAGTMASWLMDGIPFSTGAVTFSTLTGATQVAPLHFPPGTPGRRLESSFPLRGYHRNSVLGRGLHYEIASKRLL